MAIACLSPSRVARSTSAKFPAAEGMALGGDVPHVRQHHFHHGTLPHRAWNRTTRVLLVACHHVTI